MRQKGGENRDGRVDRLRVLVYGTRREMGEAAAQAFADLVRGLGGGKGPLNVVFAAAPSQDELLAALAERTDINWERIQAFHMDEYIGLPVDDPRRFARYLDTHIFDCVPFLSTHYLDPGGGAPAPELARRYEQLLRANPIHLVCLGIGENGHIAFNDPAVANFDDPQWVKIVELEESCRLQQVHDGCFAALADVPTHALTLTVPALMAAKAMICVVPGPTKRAAVARTLAGPIETACPASILRRHEQAMLFLDREAAAGIAGG